MLKLLILVAGAWVVLGPCAGRQVETEPMAVDPAAAAATIEAADMLRHIGALAHDSMMGRDTPSQGLEKAADYLASAFRDMGLEPAGEDGGFLQRYPLPLRAIDTSSVHFGVVDRAGQGNRMLEYGVDFFALPVAVGDGEDMFHGRFHWFGRLGERGLAEGEYGAGVLAVVDVPGSPDRDWRLSVTAARRQARAIGAVAVLVLLGPQFTAEMIAGQASAMERPERTLADPGEIPVFFMTRDAWAEILEREGRAAETLPDSPATPVVFENVRAHFAAIAKVLEDARPPNVVALLSGRDPELRDSYVVFSAHMDHVGVGRPFDGDSIYNGADDDASGTSALLEVAEAFASMPEPPRRSLVFLAVSGEEKGLLGSRWFTDHPTIPLDRVVANVNVDMIGRNAPDSVVVIGMEYSSLGSLVRRVAAEHPEIGISVMPDPWPEERFFFRSDHFNFARKEIPAVFFFAGVHEDYHRPSDEIDMIDGDKAARVARLIFYTARAIAESVEPPQWDPAGLDEIRALTR
jgi:hypothetical protein